MTDTGELKVFTPLTHQLSVYMFQLYIAVTIDLFNLDEMKNWSFLSTSLLLYEKKEGLCYGAKSLWLFC